MEDNCYYFDGDSYINDEFVQQGSYAGSFPRVEENDNPQIGRTNGNAKTVSPDQLMELLKKDAEKVRSLTCLSLPASILLLQHCKWISEVAKEAYFENPEKMLEDLKLTASVAAHKPALAMNAAKTECLICATEAKKGEALGLLSCEHFFHPECWKILVMHSLYTDENLCNLRCPMDGCLELVDEQTLKGLFSTQEEAPIRSKIEQHLLKNYVETSPRLSWCPNEKGCEGIIYTLKALHSCEAVECGVCHLRFCFHCKGKPHLPALCSEVQKWLRKIDDDFPNAAYVVAHTKGCPKCGVRIEKNSGCNHMVCKCQHEFCWLCMEGWSSHHGNYFSCKNAKRVDHSNDNKDDKIKFYQYYEKYMNQQDSSKKECEQVDTLKKRTLGFSQKQTNSGSPLRHDNFLTKLLEDVKCALSRAREHIAFGIVHGYYNDSNQNEIQLFLFRMGSLEEATENLSHVLSTFDSNIPNKVNELREGESTVKRWISILEG